MKKPYAESTLRRKYRETGLGVEKISLIHDYLFACARFYQIIELDEVRKILSKQGHITRAELDAVLPVMERDDFLEYSLINEGDIYQDGANQMLLVEKAFMLSDNPDFDNDPVDLALKSGDEPDLSKMVHLDWEKFYALDEQRSDKPLYVPKDILLYANDDYYEKTPQTEAMKTFLRKRCALNKQGSIFQRMNEQSFTTEPSDEEFADWTILNLVDLINDFSISSADQIKKGLELLEEIGYTFKERDLQRFMDLFSDLNNHTRMPSNRGFTPDELFRPNSSSLPREISFGPGMQAMLRSGEIDPAEFKRTVMGDADLPMELKTNLMRETERALKPGEEQWFGGTLIKGDKIRPNDPCPCGSGKKYKKCCGAKH